VKRRLPASDPHTETPPTERYAKNNTHHHAGIDCLRSSLHFPSMPLRLDRREEPSWANDALRLRRQPERFLSCRRADRGVIVLRHTLSVAKYSQW
jgi:hypothetical protein